MGQFRTVCSECGKVWEEKTDEEIEACMSKLQQKERELISGKSPSMPERGEIIRAKFAKQKQ